MKKRYEIIQAAVLLALLLLALFLKNSVVKGLILFLFSADLIANTLWMLLTMKKDGIVRQLLYGVLLFVEILLAIGAVVAMVSAIVGA